METDRLELRLLSEDDLEAWTDFLGDPEATRLLHTPEPVLDPERVLAGLRRWVAMTEGPIGMYALVERESGETVGFVGFVKRELDWDGPVYAISALTAEGTKRLAQDVMTFLETEEREKKRAGDPGASSHGA